jgi:hypothetical protein
MMFRMTVPGQLLIYYGARHWPSYCTLMIVTEVI